MNRRVAVIGAGILGASAAWALSKRGAEVTLFDRALAAGGATGDSFGWINANFAYHDPGYYRLKRTAVALHRRLARELGPGAAVQWGGSRMWTAEEHLAERMHKHVEHHKALAYPIRLINEEELRIAEPRVSPGTVRAAAWAREEGTVDAVRLTRVLIRAAQDAGAKLRLRAAVQRIDPAKAGWVVRSGDTELEVDVVLVAAGVGSPALVEPLGIPLPLIPSPGLIVQAKSRERLLNGVVMCGAGHLWQSDEGTVTLGVAWEGPAQEPAIQGMGQRAFKEASRYVPALADLSPQRCCVGWRPLPRDGYPVLGFAKSPPGLYLMVSHSGITLGPRLGQLAAREILEGSSLRDLQPYRPGRFSGR